MQSLRQARAIFESYSQRSPGDPDALAACLAQMCAIIDQARDASGPPEDRRLGDQAMSLLRISTVGNRRSAHLYRADRA